MPAFYYFIEIDSQDDIVPGGRLSEDVLAACGLAGVLSDLDRLNTDFVLNPCSKGPGGKPGFVLTPLPIGGSLEAPVQFRPNLQTWAEVSPPSTAGKLQPMRHWIGWLTEAPPGPEDLRRRKQISGHAVECSSGRQWTIPIARALPRNIVFADGEPIAKVKPAFERLWEMSARIWDFFIAEKDKGETSELSDGELVRIVMTAIGVNYRIGPAEITGLAEAGMALLDTDFLQAAALALVDVKLLNEVEKKTS